MERRYVALSVVSGMVVGGEQVPLEVAVVVTDADMKIIDHYSTPVTPSTRYDISMVAMHTPVILANALEAEGFWATMEANSMQPEAADRYVLDKIVRNCEAGEHSVVVLCDRLDVTHAGLSKFFPSSSKKLASLGARWVEVEPVKDFVESQEIYGKMDWPYRAAPRVKSLTQYALIMRRTMEAGVQAFVAEGKNVVQESAG